MKLNSSKMMFLLIMMITTLMMMSTNSILIFWMNMEINMIVFLPILTKSKLMKDQIMKYFIIQGLSSSILIMSTILNSLSDKEIYESKFLMISMLMKMGMMPTHLWLPDLMQALSWNKCILLSTIQKIPPTLILSQMTNLKLMLFPMMLSLIISPMVGVKQTSLKKMMAYSSITNSTWMIYSMKISKKMFILYFIIYSTITIMTMKMMKFLKLTFLSQMKKTNKFNQLSIMLNMLSNSGMPPTIGFLPKWMILQTMMKTSLIMTTFMILSSIMMTFLYMKLMNPMMMNSNSMKMNKTKKSFMFKMNCINMSGIPIMMTTKLI